MRICATIEARMGSSRLPGKVLMEAVGKPMLELMIERVRRSTQLDGIIVATTDKSSDDPICELAERLGVPFYRGSEADVLKRVLDAAQFNDTDVIVELTGDCPVIDPAIIDRVVSCWKTARCDYVSNSLSSSYPVGMDVQVFPTQILADVDQRTSEPDDREHVSLFIYRNPQLYSIENVMAPPEHTYPDVELTLDEPDDFRLLHGVFDALYPENPAFDLTNILDLLAQRADLSELNNKVQRTVL